MHGFKLLVIRVMCHFLFDIANMDYTPIDKTITFDIKDEEIEEMFIILDDDVLEDVKQFSLQIEAIPGPFPVTVKNSTATVSIADNDCEW